MTTGGSSMREHIFILISRLVALWSQPGDPVIHGLHMRLSFGVM
jgi:hypothetical protein